MPNVTPAPIAVHLQDCFFPAHSSPKCEISPLTWNHWVQCWLTHLAPDLPPAPYYELSLRLTSDREIASLNAQYRDRDTPTDVLAFAALEVELPPAEVLASEPLYLGDIVISVDTAYRQAQQQNHSLSTELVWLAAHDNFGDGRVKKRFQTT